MPSTHVQEIVCISSYLQRMEHALHHIQSLYIVGISYTTDCGRLNFRQLTKAFDYLVHANIHEKVRFERDLTALHMKYRCKYQKPTMKMPLKPIQNTTAKRANHGQANPQILETKIVTINLNHNRRKKAKLSLNVDRNGNKTIKLSKASAEALQNKMKNMFEQRKKVAPHSGIGKRKKRDYVMKKNDKVWNDLKYLWTYKSVMLDYLTSKQLKMPQKSIYDSLYEHSNDVMYDSNKYKVVLTVEMPFKKLSIHGSNNSAVLAEYYAFYNLFKRVNQRKYTDRTLLNKIISQYIGGFEHQIWNQWWWQGTLNTPIRDTLTYFYDMNQYCYNSEMDRAVYFYNVNCDFDREYQHCELTKDEKQMLWYHAVSYLYRDLVKEMAYESKDLLLFMMSNFYSRREFFGNVSRLGWVQSVKIMQIK